MVYGGENTTVKNKNRKRCTDQYTSTSIRLHRTLAYYKLGDTEHCQGTAKSQFRAFVSFHGANARTIVNFKLPTRCHRTQREEMHTALDAVKNSWSPPLDGFTSLPSNSPLFPGSALSLLVCALVSFLCSPQTAHLIIILSSLAGDVPASSHRTYWLISISIHHCLLPSQMMEGTGVSSYRNLPHAIPVL